MSATCHPCRPRSQHPGLPSITQVLRRLVFARDDTVAELALRAIAAYMCPPVVPFPLRDSADDVSVFPKLSTPPRDPVLALPQKDSLSVSLVWIAQSWFTDGINAVSVADACTVPGIDAVIAHGPSTVIHEFSGPARGGVGGAGASAATASGSDAPLAAGAAAGGAASKPNVQVIRVEVDGSMGASWRLFDAIVQAQGVPLDSDFNCGLLWRIRRAQCWSNAADRRRMVRMQLYALSIMLADAAAGTVSPGAACVSSFNASVVMECAHDDLLAPPPDCLSCARRFLSSPPAGYRGP